MSKKFIAVGLLAFVFALGASAQNQVWTNISAYMSYDSEASTPSFAGIRFTKTTGVPNSQTGFIGTVTKSDGKTQVGVKPGTSGQNISTFFSLKSNETTADIVLRTGSQQFVEFETWNGNYDKGGDRRLWQIQPNQEVVFRAWKQSNNNMYYKFFFKPVGSGSSSGRLKQDMDYYDFYRAVAMIEYLASINTANIKKEVDKIKTDVKNKPEFKGKSAMQISNETFNIFLNRKNLLVGTIAGLQSVLPSTSLGEYYANLKINLARAQTAYAVAYIYGTAPSAAQFKNDLWILLSDLDLRTACDAFLDSAREAGISAAKDKIQSTAQESAKKQILKRMNSSDFGKTVINASNAPLAKGARAVLKKGGAAVSAAYALTDALNAASDHIDFSDRARAYYW
jgi:hypothetical protein